MNSVETIFEKKTHYGSKGEHCVLIAEDDPVGSYLITEILEHQSVEIILAKDGKQAISLYKKNKSKIDLVIMDIRLPHICGFEATRKIKSLNNDVPVIALTAHAFAESELKCREAGCDDYLSKPFEIPDFMSLLGKYITIQ